MAATTAADAGVVRRPRKRAVGPAVLPYLLSLPALLVCIGILVPFFTAIFYSLQRYNLAFPTTRGMVWWGNYADFLTDPAFWNTLKVSLLYTREPRARGKLVTASRRGVEAIAAAIAEHLRRR